MYWCNAGKSNSIYMLHMSHIGGDLAYISYMFGCVVRFGLYLIYVWVCGASPTWWESFMRIDRCKQHRGFNPTEIETQANYGCKIWWLIKIMFNADSPKVLLKIKAAQDAWWT